MPATPPRSGSRQSRPGARHAARALGASFLLAATGPVPAGERAGNATCRRTAFETLGGGRCHRPEAGPAGQGSALEMLGRPQGALVLAGRFWNHAPAMVATADAARIPGPRPSPEEMVDLMAFLAADPARDAAADSLQGPLVLVRKGCLKCQALRGEGGTVGPEFAALRDRSESASGRGAAVWRPSPRTVLRAARLGVSSPRFAGDERRQLVALLRTATGGRP